MGVIFSFLITNAIFDCGNSLLTDVCGLSLEREKIIYFGRAACRSDDPGNASPLRRFIPKL